MSRKSQKKHQQASMHPKNTTFNIIKRELLRDKLALGSFIFLATVIVLLIISLFIIDEAETLQITLRGNLDRLNQAPSRYFWLGTDARGRDGVALLMIAARNSLTITILTTLISSSFGIVYGLISGYTGRRIDRLMMGIIDIITVIPNLITMIVLLGFLGGFSTLGTVVAISLLAWTGIARVVRAKLIQEKELEYIQASKTLGTPHIKIIFQKLVPNLSTTIIASIALNATSIIIMETGLAFFELVGDLPAGLVRFPADTPSLGTLIAVTGYMHVLRSRWWLWVPPTVLVALIIFSINSIGNMLSRAADARQRLG